VHAVASTFNFFFAFLAPFHLVLTFSFLFAFYSMKKARREFRTQACKRAATGLFCVRSPRTHLSHHFSHFFFIFSPKFFSSFLSKHARTKAQVDSLARNPRRPLHPFSLPSFFLFFYFLFQYFSIYFFFSLL
jgi:hypothetical protein